MTTHYELTAVMPSVSGLTADEVENTFAFQYATDATDAQLDTMLGTLSHFYTNTVTGMTHAIGAWLSPELSRVSNAARIDCYKRPATPGGSGSPVRTMPFTLPAAASSTAMPGQDCLVLSFNADLSGVPETGAYDTAIPSTRAAIRQGAPTTHAGYDKDRARRRGRIFVGPLAQNVSSGPNNEARPGSAFITDLSLAAAQLALESSDVSWDWEVFSRRAWTGYVIVGGWIDNRFDTQRKRLEKATARTTWSA